MIIQGSTRMECKLHLSKTEAEIFVLKNDSDLDRRRKWKLGALRETFVNFKFIKFIRNEFNLHNCFLEVRYGS